MIYSKRLITYLIFLSLLSSGLFSQEYQYSIGLGASQSDLSGGSFFDLKRDKALQFQLGSRLADRWILEFGYASNSFENNTSASLNDSVLSLRNNSPLLIRGDKFTFQIKRFLASERSLFTPFVGAGGGLLVWKGVDPNGDTTYSVRSDKLENTDYAATELIISASGGLRFRPSNFWALDISATSDYLTSAGAEFEKKLSSSRDNLLLTVSASLRIFLGTSPENPQVRRFFSQQSSPESNKRSGEQRTVASGRDRDGDGIADDNDRCPGTERGVVVDHSGCPKDTDRDGVPDGLDDCPDSPREAIGRVDLFGCAIDRDFDGIADYKDICPDNPVGANVDSIGCPIDTDKDGVPNGLDDCPLTMPGIAVDPNGCIDLSMFDEPMVLNIDYPPGSFEIDPNNKERLRRLAGLLNFVSDIRLEVSGYTDNIGTIPANRSLSEKRANRVRDFLVTQGVGTERIKVFGRGEANFVASNQTSAGRAKNRRIEILFYR